MSTLEKLTPKQERFCQEYVIDLNGAQAAIRAGYASKDAHAQASRLSANVGIKKRVADLQKAKASSLDLKAEDVLRETTKLAYADPKTFKKSQMTTRDKLKALEMLAKHLNLFAQTDSTATAININVIKTTPRGGDNGGD